MTPAQVAYLAGWSYAARTVANSRWYEVVDQLSLAMAWSEDFPTAPMTAYAAGKIDSFHTALEMAP